MLFVSDSLVFLNSAILCSAHLQYLSSFSKPTYLLPVDMHAMAVVPLPMQLSSITSPGFVYVLMSHSIRATGFWVGWSGLGSLSK